MRVGVKLLLVAAAVVAAGLMIGFYVSHLTTLAGSPAYSLPVQNVNGHPVVDLQIQTVAAIGPKLTRFFAHRTCASTPSRTSANTPGPVPGSSVAPPIRSGLE